VPVDDRGITLVRWLLLEGNRYLTDNNQEKRGLTNSYRARLASV